jgi:hypothetical protein
MGGGGGAVRGASSTAARPPLASHRPWAGGPERYVPSLHRIVAPAGGVADAAARRAAGAGAAAAAPLAALGGVGVLRTGILATSPP